MPAALDRQPVTLPESHPADQSPISFLGGMGYDHARNQLATDHFHSIGHPIVAALAEPDIHTAPKGYRVVSSETGTRIMSRPFAYLETAKPDTVLITSLQQETRADELIGHIEQQAATPVTHIAQSADAQNAIIAAHKRPDLFKNLILMFPSGMVKKQRRTEYLRQIAGSMRDEKAPKSKLLPENDFEASTRAASMRDRLREKRYKKSGGYTLAASAIAAYNNGLLHDMRAQEGAPGVALVLGLQDKMMRPDRIIESLVSADDVDYILITNSGHGINGRKDLAAEVSQLTALLSARNAQRQAARVHGEPFTSAPLGERLFFMPDVPKEQQQKLRALAERSASA